MYEKAVFIILCVLNVIQFTNGENYTVLFDAGSTGTRVYVYKWKNKNILDSIEEVVHKRVHPGMYN